jgi:hypothetical protein
MYSNRSDDLQIWHMVVVLAAAAAMVVVVPKTGTECATPSRALLCLATKLGKSRDPTASSVCTTNHKITEHFTKKTRCTIRLSSLTVTGNLT